MSTAQQGGTGQGGQLIPAHVAPGRVRRRGCLGHRRGSHQLRGAILTGARPGHDHGEPAPHQPQRPPRPSRCSEILLRRGRTAEGSSPPGPRHSRRGTRGTRHPAGHGRRPWRRAPDQPRLFHVEQLCQPMLVGPSWTSGRPRPRCLRRSRPTVPPPRGPAGHGALRIRSEIRPRPRCYQPTCGSWLVARPTAGASPVPQSSGHRSQPRGRSRGSGGGRDRSLAGEWCRTSPAEGTTPGSISGRGRGGDPPRRCRPPATPCRDGRDGSPGLAEAEPRLGGRRGEGCR